MFANVHISFVGVVALNGLFRNANQVQEEFCCDGGVSFSCNGFGFS